MEIGVGKEGCHFCEQLIQENIYFFIGRIQHRVKDPEIALKRIVSFYAGQFRVSRQDRRGMRGDDELGNDPDTTLRGIADDLADIGLRIIQPVGGHLLQPGKNF